MSSIASQRCFNHHNREAVACCPECDRFFCRECITEHDDKVICAPCLRTLGVKDKKAKVVFKSVRIYMACFLSFFLAWLIFFSLGQLLLKIPSAFHEGAIWHDKPVVEP